jgi:transcriptional regulator with XRE-family HTH domain
MMEPIPKPPIARNLRYAQSRKGGTWQTLAQTLGVSERLVASWRKDTETDPSWGNILRLSAYYDVPPEWWYADHVESRES